MPLQPGIRLGIYEIIAAIGAGGMGEVYRARDTKLNRDVALKVLPDLFANDVERLARFTREAQTLASLNHSNIATVYGIEESGSVRALSVMELVEGEDLSQRIAQGPVPLDEALAVASQIAEAPRRRMSRNYSPRPEARQREGAAGQPVKVLDSVSRKRWSRRRDRRRSSLSHRPSQPPR